MTATGQQIDRRLAVGLICLFVFVYLLPLGIRPLANPDEVRYGEIAREMIATGDWVTPRLNGVRYFEKPIMGHWLNALSFETLGESAFALRLPSALAAGLTALLIFWLTAKFAGRRAGLLASGIYLTTLAVFGIGTFAVLDTYLTLFLTAGLACYFLACRSDSRTPRMAWLAAFGAAAGCAFLTKGFLGFVIPGIVIAPYLVLTRRWRALLSDPWIPALVAIAVALPWALLIHQREPDFWRYFVVVEHLQRFMGEGEMVQHARPWWYFVAVLPLFAFPWIFFGGRAWTRIRAGAPDGAFVRYLIAWAVLPFLFFSASSGKLATYVLPCLVPLSMLLAVGLAGLTSAGRPALPRWPFAVTALMLGGGFVVLVGAQLALADPVYAATETPAFLFAAGALLAGGALPLVAMRSRRPLRQLTLTALGVIPLYLVLSLALPARVIEDKAPEAFIARHGPYPANTLLVSDSSLFNALAWTLRRHDVYVLGQSEVDYGMSYPDAHHRRLDPESLEALISGRGPRDVVLLIKDSREPLVRDLMPHTATRAELEDLVLWRVRGVGHPNG